MNRKDRIGRNVFEGGFLGLDNIGVFDRSTPLPTGGYLDQADGTAWMALYARMLDIAIELAQHDPVYEDFAIKFFEHFLWIAAAMDRVGDDDEMWDEEDGFFYDVLRLPDGRRTRLKVRSMVGLLPLCAITVIEPTSLEQLPRTSRRACDWFLDATTRSCSRSSADPRSRGVEGRCMLSLARRVEAAPRARALLDEDEFLSPLRHPLALPLSPRHPYVFDVRRPGLPVDYLPAESDDGHVRRQLQLARTGLDAGQRADHPRPAAVLHVLRRRLPGRVPDRLGPTR